MPEDEITNLPLNFRDELKILKIYGISTWERLNNLENSEICSLSQKGRASLVNLRRLKGIANLIYELKINFEEAALLIHSGIASIKVLASFTPQELIYKTSRLERNINSKRKPYLDLQKAHSWIQRAKNRQILN